MSKRRIPVPKSQKQIQRESIDAYDPSGVPVVEDKKTKRSLNRRVDDVKSKPFNIGLKDIDEAIVYYFENVIRPSVIQNNNKIQVPLLYGSPERWNAVQKEGFYRDKNGKIMTPLIMFKRDTIEKNRNLGNKLDANNPLNYGIYRRKYSNKNYYDNFSVLSNRIPVQDYIGVVIPDYVTITYSCVIFTDYVEQMNKIVEAINYASDSYWGDPDRFNFRAMINNYSTGVELTKGQDRAVKTNFTIELLGYIIPDNINTELLGSRRFFSKSRVMFKLETVSGPSQLQSRSNTPENESTRRFYDDPGIPNDAILSDLEIIFLSTSNSAVSNLTTTNQALFYSKVFLTPPPGYTLDENSFTVYVNGISVNPQHVLVEEYDSSIKVTFNPTLIGYDIEPSDIVVLTGKFK